METAWQAETGSTKPGKPGWMEMGILRIPLRLQKQQSAEGFMGAAAVAHRDNCNRTET